MSLDLLSLYLFNPETLNLNMCLIVHLNMYMSMYFFILYRVLIKSGYKLTLSISACYVLVFWWYSKIKLKKLLSADIKYFH